MDMDKFANSQYAIRDYLHADSNNEFPHDTEVVVKQNSNIDFEGRVSAWARIETNYSHVDINWGKDYLDKKYYPQYRNDYQEFKYNGEFLIVFAKDRAGNNIEITIR